MEIANLEKYRKDLDKLIDEGSSVHNSLGLMILGRSAFIKQLCDLGVSVEKAEAQANKLKPFATAYQHWYSEALALVKQLLPDRANDFIRLYEKPKTRKDISYSTYCIEDACQNLLITLGGETKVDASAAIPLLTQQQAIVAAIKRRFDSSLFDIKQLVQADLYDDELSTARALLKAGFARAAGAIAGVVLEGHLKEVAAKHGLPKNLKTINPLNVALKGAGIIDQAQSRRIEFLGDVRNKCGHKGSSEPTTDDVEDLISGADKVIKTIF
ncbi:hypothetical protein ACI2KG_08835 [Pseudomonas sp. NPDC089407]|uniref:hypothetical protein n=1 Tax=Pseudomonas sp. NPDC089407 TaxID=3364464 RepID=UPI0038509495